jgi:hypothetical protein
LQDNAVTQEARKAHVGMNGAQKYAQNSDQEWAEGPEAVAGAAPGFC